MKVTGLKEIRDSLLIGEHSDKAIRRVLFDTYAKYRKRIFEAGQASDGGAIGAISTEAGYFNPKDFPKPFPAKGKAGKTKFKNGKAHVTAYFAAGYSGAKKASGRAGKIDMYLTGDLQRNLLPFAEGDEYTFSFTSDLADKKASGNEERFKKLIFDPTESEIQNFVDKLAEASQL